MPEGPNPPGPPTPSWLPKPPGPPNPPPPPPMPPAPPAEPNGSDPAKPPPPPRPPPNICCCCSRGTPFTYSPSGPVTFDALIRPSSPFSTSNSTCSPSASDRNPWAWIAVWCTKTSSPPSCGVMNPNPFVTLKNLTMPDERLMWRTDRRRDSMAGRCETDDDGYDTRRRSAQSQTDRLRNAATPGKMRASPCGLRDGVRASRTPRRRLNRPSPAFTLHRLRSRQCVPVVLLPGRIGFALRPVRRRLPAVYCR